MKRGRVRENINGFPAVSERVTDHWFAPVAPGWTRPPRRRLCAGTGPGPAPVAPGEAPSRVSGSTVDRWRTAGCTRRKSRPPPWRTRGSTRNPARAQSLRRSRSAAGTAPGARRCSPGSETPSLPARRRSAWRTGSASWSRRTSALLQAWIFWSLSPRR